MSRDGWVYATLGSVGAIALAFILMPLREHTSAAHLAFAFVLLTIVVAETGGRGPALVTATVSAASLDFFLTRPYLSLRIEDPGDIIAFLGLGACALVAAAFGRRRHEFSEAARRSNRDVDALNGLVARMEAGVPLPEVLDGLRQSFDLERMALRDAQDRVVAVSPPGSAPSPRAELDPATLLERDSTRYTWGGHGFRLPEGGGRVLLAVRSERVALDLWGGPADGFSHNDRRALSAAAAILALELSRRRA